MAEIQHIHPAGDHPPAKVRVIRAFVWAGVQHPVGTVLDLPMHDARMLQQDSKVEPVDAVAPVLPVVAADPVAKPAAKGGKAAD